MDGVLSMNIVKRCSGRSRKNDGLFNSDLIHVPDPLRNLFGRFSVCVGMHVNDWESRLGNLSNGNFVNGSGPVILQQYRLWRSRLGLFLRIGRSGMCILYLFGEHTQSRCKSGGKTGGANRFQERTPFHSPSSMYPFSTRFPRLSCTSELQSSSTAGLLRAKDVWRSFQANARSDRERFRSLSRPHSPRRDKPDQPSRAIPRDLPSSLQKTRNTSSRFCG